MQLPPQYKDFDRDGKQMAMILNPTQNNEADDPFSQSYVIRAGDELILMAYEKPQLEGLTVEAEG